MNHYLWEEFISIKKMVLEKKRKNSNRKRRQNKNVGK